MSNRVLFLDYDGVVNTAMWNQKGTKCSYNFPEDGKVNNFQAVQWISEFCQKCKYDIVVTSTWRTDSNYKECLINGGLRPGINIVGKTPVLYDSPRGDEIKKFLSVHPEIKYYIIIDDDRDMLQEQLEHCVFTDSYRGFGEPEFQKCIKIFMKDKGHKGSFW